MNNTFDFSFFSLGTMNNVKIYSERELPEKKCELLRNEIIARVREIDDHMSAFKDYSDVTKIMEYHGERVSVHRDTWQVLSRAEWFYKNSRGAFDITIRPLTRLWGIGKKNSYIPAPELILQAMGQVDASKIVLWEEDTSAGCYLKEVELDLGGIAKGYAADEVKRILLNNNIFCAIINLGGNIVALGERPDNTKWRIGIQNPMGQRGEYLAVAEIRDKTVVTSGVNERFFIKDNVRYHHILDPGTGYPAQSGLLSVTAICDKSIDADALTTSAFVMGLKEGMELFEKVGADGVFVTSDLEIVTTSGCKESIIIKRNKPEQRRSSYVC